MTNQPVLRRDSAHKVAAGVCAGLARRFQIDPVIIRVMFVLAAVAADGLGLLLYLILWIALPSDAGASRGRPGRSPARALVFFGAAATVLGVAFPNTRSTTLILALLVVLVFGLLSAGRRPTDTPQLGAASPPLSPPGLGESYVWQQPPTSPPSASPASGFGAAQVPARRPRTWRWVLTGVSATTAALCVIDLMGGSVPTSAFFSAALAVIGLALVSASRPRLAVHGRPRGLVALGLALSLVTVALLLPATPSASVAAANGSIATASGLADDSQLSSGTHTIDLRDLTLDTDRTVTLQQDAGRLVVQLPQHVNTVIHYEVGIGQVALPQSGETNGVDLRGSETQIADESAPTLTLLVQLNMGQLEFTS